MVVSEMKILRFNKNPTGASISKIHSVLLANDIVYGIKSTNFTKEH